MDSPSDLFCQQSSPMCPFGLYRSPSGSAPSAPRCPGGSPPTYPLMSPLLHPNSASQSWGGYRQRPGLFQAPSLEQDLEDGMEDQEQEDDLLVRGQAAAMAGPTLLSHLFPGGMRRGVVSEPEEWCQDVLQVKRLRMDNMGKRDGETQEGEDEKRGRTRSTQRKDEEEARIGGQPRKGSREGRKRQRQELKLQLQETREKLLELQKKVWKAYDKQQTQEDQRRDTGKSEGEKGMMEAEEMEEMFLEEGEEDDHAFNADDLLPTGHISSKKHSQQNMNGTGDLSPDETIDLDVDLDQDLDRGSVWVGCGLVHGEWEGPGGGQKFAQALKQELGSAVARVIDRVIRLYADSENIPPPSSAALVVHDQRNGGFGSGLVNIEEEQRRPSGAALSQALEQSEASSLVPSRHQEKRNNGHSGFPPNIHRGPMPPHSNPNLPHLPQPPLQALLPPRAKEPFLPSFPSGPPGVPLPLLHYTMQHLFARSLSNMPLHKDSMPSEPFLDFRSHGHSFPPLPLLGQLEPPLSSSGRGRDGGIRGGGSGGGMGGLDGGDGSLYLGAASSQEGLSPCHLKKAKLMFFYARYPSSNTLKTYFPDVKFNRCVTSQLIKWFSNFREFFYIQMERFARQAVRDGVMAPREGPLRLGRNSELFRILNMHYNKSNDYQVPERFVEVAELALREFFNAIHGGRDTDPCWKKSIYKIICKLDSPIPDSFRLPGCPVDTHRSV